MKELLLKLNACGAAISWAGDKSWKEVYDTCHRGDWLLWLFARTSLTGMIDKRFFRAKAAYKVCVSENKDERIAYLMVIFLTMRTFYTYQW